METKKMPRTILVSLIVLGAIFFFGFIVITFKFSFWHYNGGPFPFASFGHAIIYGVMPLLAIFDLLRRKPSGRYWAILPILCSSAVMFRVFVEMVFTPLIARRESASSFMIVLAIAISLAALSVALGFNEKAIAYLHNPDDEDATDPVPEHVPMVSLFGDADTHRGDIGCSVTSF